MGGDGFGMKWPGVRTRCLGMEHTRFTYRFQRRDYRLTDVFGKVVPELLV